MNTTRKILIAGALISAMIFGGSVVATTDAPLVTLGNGCCRTAVSPLEPPPVAPLADPTPPVTPTP